MNLQSIKSRLQSKSIYFSQDEILSKPTVIGYEKKFKLTWMATQLNTFVVATDFGEEKITVDVIEKHIKDSFNYAKKNYSGWPRGFQSGLGVISMLVSTDITEEAKQYCIKLKSGKKWAGFSIPVVVDSLNQKVYSFSKNPMWGRIYYPHFKKIINELKQ